MTERPSLLVNAGVEEGRRTSASLDVDESELKALRALNSLIDPETGDIKADVRKELKKKPIKYSDFVKLSWSVVLDTYLSSWVGSYIQYLSSRVAQTRGTGSILKRSVVATYFQCLNRCDCYDVRCQW